MADARERASATPDAPEALVANKHVKLTKTQRLQLFTAVTRHLDASLYKKVYGRRQLSVNFKKEHVKSAFSSGAQDLRAQVPKLAEDHTAESLTKSAKYWFEKVQREGAGGLDDKPRRTRADQKLTDEQYQLMGDTLLHGRWYDSGGNLRKYYSLSQVYHMHKAVVTGTVADVSPELMEVATEVYAKLCEIKRATKVENMDTLQPEVMRRCGCCSPVCSISRLYDMKPRPDIHLNYAD